MSVARHFSLTCDECGLITKQTNISKRVAIKRWRKDGFIIKNYGKDTICTDCAKDIKERS